MANRLHAIALLLLTVVATTACDRSVDYVHTQPKGKSKPKVERPREDYAFTERAPLPAPVADPIPLPDLSPAPTRIAKRTLESDPAPVSALDVPGIAASPAPFTLKRKQWEPALLPEPAPIVLFQRTLARTPVPSLSRIELAWNESVERPRWDLQPLALDITRLPSPSSPSLLAPSWEEPQLVPHLDLPLRRDLLSPAPLTEPLYAPVTELFVQGEILNKFDLMFVVDNSESMADIKEYVRQNLQELIEPLALKRRQLDWRAAVTITDPFGRKPYFFRTHRGQAFVGGKAPLAASQWNALQQDWNSVLSQIGPTQLQGWEQGLKAASLTLSNDFHQFARKQAHLVVIWLSDEDDYSASSGFRFSIPADRTEKNPGPEYHRDLWTEVPVSAYKKYFEDVEKHTGGEVLLYPVVHNDAEKGPVCDNEQPDKPPSVGKRYMELVKSWDPSRAEALSICKEALHDSFARIVQKTADVDVCFQLKEPLQELRVTVDGKAVLESAEKGYTVRSGEEMRICFLGDYRPAVGQTIRVEGTPIDSLPPRPELF